MDIPQDLDANIASLLLTYYVEWVLVYGNTVGAELKFDSPVDEATLAELTNITFLAAMSVVKFTEFLSRLEMCKINFYWLLFASEPLLHLAESTDAYLANEARQALQKTLVIFKTLLKDKLFSPNFHNLQLEGNRIVLGQGLVERISHLSLHMVLNFSMMYDHNLIIEFVIYVKCDSICTVLFTSYVVKVYAGWNKGVGKHFYQAILAIKLLG